VARWAEERARDRAEELAEVVAAHYLQAIAYREDLDELPDSELDAAASRWAATAGERAMRLWQPKEAYRWYGEAVRLGERSGLDQRDLARLMERAVEASTGSASFAETRELARRAFGLFEASDDPQGMARMEHRVAAAAFDLGEHDEVAVLVERAIARFEPLGESRELAAILEFYGNFLRRQGHVEKARPLLERALEIATTLDEPAVAGQAALSLGIVLVHLGDIRGGMEMTERGYAAAQEAGELQLLLRAHNTLVSTTMDYAPDYPRGWDLIWRGIELSQRSGRRDYEGWLWQNAGNYAFDQGKLDVLERAAAMTREIGDSLSYHHIRQSADYYKALLLFLRGDLDAAEASLALSFAADPELQALPYMFVLQGDIAEARGDREAAIAAYREAVERVEDERMLGMVDEAMTRLIRALALAGRANEAAPHLEGLRAISCDRPGAMAGLVWAEAMLAGDPHVRVEWLRAAVEEFEQVGRVVDEARARLDLADALDAAGLEGAPERERAHTMLEEQGVRAFRADSSRTVLD
jgi:tetratricopeptide (TPR) repeat protein